MAAYKCPKCESENYSDGMINGEIGFIPNGLPWYKYPFSSKQVAGRECAQCGYLELYTQGSVLTKKDKWTSLSDGRLIFCIFLFLIFICIVINSLFLHGQFHLPDIEINR